MSNFSSFDFESLPFSLNFFQVTLSGGNPWPSLLLEIPFGMFAGIFGFAGTLEKFLSFDKFSLYILIEFLYDNEDVAGLTIWCRKHIEACFKQFLALLRGLSSLFSEKLQELVFSCLCQM